MLRDRRDREKRDASVASRTKKSGYTTARPGAFIEGAHAASERKGNLRLKFGITSNLRRRPSLCAAHEKL